MSSGRPVNGPADRLPIVEEQAHVTKRQVATEHVRVRTVVDTHEHLLTDTLAVEALEVERRPVERAVSDAPAPRQEGDATIISLVEERLIVTRQLYVVEEVVVRRIASHEPVSVPLTLRATHAVVERKPVAQQEDN